MIILIGILVFAVFIALDLLKERQRRAELLVEGEDLHGALGSIEPEFVAGFKLPPVLNYHRGHTWVHWVSEDQAYVGVNDFARRLIGAEARFTPPAPGTQVEQGEGVIAVERDGNAVLLASPVGGEVIGINPDLKADGSRVYRDNYVDGWLYKIRSPHLFKEIPNLLDGQLAKRWLEDSIVRFHHRLTLVTGNVMQDGGESVEDIASGLDRRQWRTLAGEFLAARHQSPERKVT